MTEMEKVINGLEFTKAMITFNPSTGEDIEPGNLNEADKTSYDACVGAIALLKEQEPRVMVPTEVYTADFVYVEFDGVITPALRTSKEREGHRESYFATQQLGGEWMRWDDYGITWRCWTSRPTDEQKKAVKWE